MIELLFLNRSQVASILSMHDAIRVVENAFSALARGDAEVPPVINIQIAKAQGEVDIKSGYMSSIDKVAVKVAAGFWENPQTLGLPSVIATILLIDGLTGVPLAVMDASYITALRTGAAGAVAAKHLARGNARVVGVIGAGSQARMQIRGLFEVRDIESVRVFDPLSPERAQSYVDEMGFAFPGIRFWAVKKADEAVVGADIVVTTTPSTSPLVQDEWIVPGTHIAAIGADAPGKQELSPAIFRRALIVVDRLSQCRQIGELQHALKQGIVSERDVDAELGEIVAGLKPGRQFDEQISVFDSTGVAVQDIATASLVYGVARENGIGFQLNWF